MRDVTCPFKDACKNRLRYLLYNSVYYKLIYSSEEYDNFAYDAIQYIRNIYNSLNGFNADDKEGSQFYIPR
ncbi:hypothetical protein C922_04588 [Plasmodium inui San Antonio 1]|uniref:Uncharacterized protein n=1 Tax=Plasmodium inui San Antonio 1 TaxID=1237626 RepID=W7A190_9APIC|nr:hypothetical protein C922_04588 [Plasmodium inui San Antonio 1]EUD65073.1 hypothetical protein C922_04588 [Plasmodium inui San Antonio 1]